MNYDSLPTNVYYDVNIINNDQTGTKAPPRLVFQTSEHNQLSPIQNSTSSVWCVSTWQQPTLSLYGFLRYNSTRLLIIQT